MPIRRPLAALFFAGLIALTGCTADGEGPGEGEETSPGAGEGESAAPEEMAPPEPDVGDLPDVVAQVNGVDIGKDQFIATYEGQLQQAFMMQQGSGEEINQDELKKQVADQLVNNLLLVQAAENAGFDASDDDVDAALEDLGAQNGLGGIDEVLAAFEAQGISEDVVREDAASQVKINAFLDQEMDVDEPSDDELRKQYDGLVEQMEAQGEEPGPEGEVPPFEEVRDLLADQATQEQKNAEVSRILDGLLENADITIHL